MDKCFDFSNKIYLASGKSTTNRTTGQYRGLGGIIDSFFIGKLIEIGVTKVVEKGSRKKCILDFGIHTINKENVTDPDIIKIKEGGKEREPRLFIEIKNVSPNDRWLGLTEEQFNTILKNKIVDEDKSKAFVICASLLSKNEEKDSDLLGVYLKSNTNLKNFEKYCDISDLYVKIQYIFSIKELERKGTQFKEKSNLYETDIFQETGERTRNQIINRTIKQTIRKVNVKGNVLPIIMRNYEQKPKEFGDFLYQGELTIYKKKNKESRRMYIDCITDVTITNKVLGKFHLQAGKMYGCVFETVGQNPSLKRNNIWIAQRNLSNVVSEPIDKRIGHIRNKI